MKRFMICLLTLSSVFILTACNTDELEQEIADLKTELDVTKQDYDKLEEDYNNTLDEVERLNGELSSEKEKNLEAASLIENYINDIDMLLNQDNENIKTLSYSHINGFGDQRDDEIIILKEYSMRTYVAYQVTYLSCDSRPANYNTHTVMYIEINKVTNDVKFISFNMDETNTYQVGLWGDSFTTPAGRTYQDFVDYYIPWFVGKSSDDLEGISVFKNESYYGITNTKNIMETDFIDAFAGSSMTTNNMLRVVKELLAYHDNNYN